MWIDNGDFDEPSDCDFNNGKVHNYSLYYQFYFNDLLRNNDVFDILYQATWIAVTTGMGLAVGLIRWLISYPENLPGFFKEIKECHIDPHHVLPTVSLSVLSLAGGGGYSFFFMILCDRSYFILHTSYLQFT